MFEEFGALIRNLFWASLALLAAAGIVWKLYSPAGNDGTTTTTVREEGIPYVIRTPGGLLEVAIVNANEYFKRSDPKTIELPLNIWTMDLGETISEIHVPATYRYHIELAPEWRVEIHDKTCVVEAPPIRPSLPVAIDTARIEKRTENGWARFNKNENLDALERSISPELAKKAASARYLQLMTPYARQTVKEFITNWLNKQQGLRYPVDQVIVLFPGENVK